MVDFAQARRTMVDCQLRTFDISDTPLLDAMNTVPRERFVLPGRETLAYMDQAIPVTQGENSRFLLAPMIVGRMIQALAVEPGNRVLDVACGLGYTCAVLARLGASVVGLEDRESLAAAAGERLASTGTTGVTLAVGQLDRGHADGAPYDAILINGAVEVEPDALLRQLREGGRLVCIRGRGHAGTATLFVCAGEAFGSRSLFDAAAPLLPAFRAEPSFVF
jgi:protein-L-isoaspartate(D-aspartate) O-methyltransferase